jgi:hypothetical protein
MDIETSRSDTTHISGLFGLIPNFLLMKQDHRSERKVLQRFEHPTSSSSWREVAPAKPG